MKRIKLFVLFNFVVQFLYGQDTSLIFIGENLKIDSIFKLESKLSIYNKPEINISQFNKNNPFFKYASTAILNNVYYPYTEKFPIDKEVLFYRQDSLLDLTTNYHYNESDSLIVLIFYDWEMGRHEKNIIKRNELQNKSKLTIKDYESYYAKILKFLIERYGNSTNSFDGIKKADKPYSEISNTWILDEFIVSLSYLKENKRIRLCYSKKME